MYYRNCANTKSKLERYFLTTCLHFLLSSTRCRHFRLILSREKAILHDKIEGFHRCSFIVLIRLKNVLRQSCATWNQLHLCIISFYHFHTLLRKKCGKYICINRFFNSIGHLITRLRSLTSMKKLWVSLRQKTLPKSVILNL